jgi:pyruvate/2-oxoglutarate dehydrogenase complex dihydrolipoamide dehydrogenase (E3) component
MIVRPLHDDLDTTDAHDRLLLDRVRPRAWTNPEPRARYHLVVLGAGTAGLVTAAGAAGLGARVALVEQRLMGGDCLVTGCVPSKALLRAAGARNAQRGLQTFGLSAPMPIEGDFGHVMARLRGLRAEIGVHDSAERFRGLGVDVFLGTGRFVSPDAIEVDGRQLRFRRAVIATGSAPRVPPIPGLDDCGYLTNETVFELREQPRSLLVVGAGPVGCELGQAFARLGTQVTLVSRGPRLLSRDEPDAAGIVEASMARDGVRVLLGAELEQVTTTAGVYRCAVRQGRDVEVVSADALLVAAGRVPRVAGLGLDRAGIAHGPEGLEVDDRLRTSNRRVFAAGDVALPIRFTHAADAMARLVVRNALFFGRSRASALVVPRCTYTAPELAQVGLTRAELTRRGTQWDEVEVAFDRVDRSVIDHECDGFLRLLLARGTDRILGGTIVGAHAGTLSGELSAAVTHGWRLGQLGAAIRPYPTISEIFRKASDASQRRRLTPRTRRLFDGWFRLFS